MTTLTIYIDPKLKDELKEIAKKRGRPWSISSVMAAAAEELVEKEKKKS